MVIKQSFMMSVQLMFFGGHIETKQSVTIFLKNIHIVGCGFNFYFFKRLNKRKLSILHSKYDAIKSEEYQKMFLENFAFSEINGD